MKNMLTDKPTMVNAPLFFWRWAINSFLVLSFVLFFVEATNAQVSGTVFRDFNANGTQQTSGTHIEPGCIGVVVQAFSPSGTLTVTYTGGGSATNSTGQYTVTGGTLGQIRLEFTMPDAYTFASNGAAGGTTVVFPTASTQNLALNYPADYCQAAPNVVTTCYVNGRPVNHTSFTDVIVSYPYDASGTTSGTNNTYLAYAGQIGSTWGVAYNRQDRLIYTAAFLKRHVAMKDNDGNGKEDIGAIYVLTPSGSPALWLDLATLGVDVGLSLMPTIATRGLPNDNVSESHDAAVFPLVGKIGLGDIDISDDNKLLYVVNLYDKKVYTIDIATQALVGTGVSVPNPGTGGEVRPFGLTFHKGKLYVGAICDATTTNSTADLKAAVYRLDGVSFTNVFSAPFNLNYPKGAAFNDGTTKFGTQWNPWRDVFLPMIGFNFGGQNNPCLPQPMLVDIEFDVNEDMVMIFNDRLGHQTGTVNWSTNTADVSTYYSSVVGGDILRAAYTVGGYVLENNGTAGSLTGQAGNNEGPGGGEFYPGDRSLSGGSFFYHEENVQGGGLFLPGRREIAVHVADPINPWSGGTFWMSNINGTNNRSYEIFPQLYDVTLFGKSNGLGDMEVMCDPAPLEIGNRIWIDTDKDGVQDAGEAGVGSVTIELYADFDNDGMPDGIALATTTTAADGSWFFSASNVTDGDPLTAGNQAGPRPSKRYLIRVGSSDWTAGAGVAELLGYTLTTANVTSNGQDQRDNDAALANNIPTISYLTGNAGENNHTLDMGFQLATCALSISSVTATCQAGQTGKYNVVVNLSYTDGPGGTITVTLGTGQTMTSSTTSVGSGTTSVTFTGLSNAGATGVTVNAFFTNDNTCAATQATYNAPVNCCPPSQNICAATGEQYLLTADAGHSSYQWYLNGNPISGAMSNTYTATQAGTYTWTATDVSNCPINNCCPIVLVSSCPCINPSNNPPTAAAGTCTGLTANNNASITITGITNADRIGISTAGAGSYNGPAYGAPATTIVGGTHIFSNLIHNTLYRIRIFNGSNDCYTDVVVTTPTIDCSCTNPILTTLTNETICEGGTFTAAKVTTTVTNGVPVTFQWYNNNGTNNPGTSAISGQNSATLTALPTAVGSYTYLVRATNTTSNTCFAEQTVTLIITTQGNAGTDTPIASCAGSGTVVNLFTQLTGEQTGGTWVRLTGAGGTFDSGAGTFTVSSTATTSLFRYTVGTAPCQDTEDLIITVYPAGTCKTTTVVKNSN